MSDSKIAEEITQRLEAILAADAAGYSRLMGEDERATVATLNAYRAVFRERIEAHHGRVVDMAGDSVLAVFTTAIGAVEAAVGIQKELGARNGELPEQRRMAFRIGVNLGDIIEQEDGTVYGDGVNIAGRLQSIGEPGGVCISGTVYDQIEGKLPLSFRFAGEQQVKNIVKPVRAYRVALEGSVPTRGANGRSVGKSRRRALSVAAGLILIGAVVLGAWQLTRTSPHVAGKNDPVVAVLAFANMSGDPQQEYFSDGVTENIIDTLAQVRNLRVIARTSTFRYKGQAVDVRQVGEELGAQYLVEGSVRRSAQTLRITAQLIETGTGSHVWSKTYDRELTAKNVFAIQDEIATGIVNTVAGAYGVLRQHGLAVAKRKPPSELSSYDCVLLGIEYTHTLSLQTYRRARDCLEKAIEVDPDYAAVWSYLSLVYDHEYTFGYDPRPGSMDRAIEAAQRAVRLAPDEAFNRSTLAETHFFRGELAEFKAETDRAIELSPKGSTAFGALGVFLCYAGEWEKGLALIEQAKMHDPYFPGWYHSGAFHDHYRKGEYAAALAAALRGNLPDWAQAQSLIVAAYGQLGRADEAKPYVKRIREIDPGFEVNARKHWHKRFQYQPEYLERLLEGMRKGGLKVPAE